ncbi:MAG: tyrosine recombinase XerC [Betaproteobacteria bacterium]|nr:tyrosine recombinase XerC [Betaproteobacteria bacterium]
MAKASQAQVERFIEHLAHSRRLSAHTMAAYAADLDALVVLLGVTPIEKAAPHQIRHAVAQLHSRGAAPRTLARRLSAWRTCFAWLVRFHGMPANPAAGIRAPKIARQLPQALSPDAVTHLLDRAPSGALEIRDRAMFELLYSSGLRLSELCLLTVDHASSVLREGEVTVQGKGGKTRTVPVGQRARDALGEWSNLRGAIAQPAERALFVGARGARISPSVVQTRLKRWGVAAGVGANVHPHVLRHSFATHVLQSSGDLRAVQDMLGHASISSTQIYTHLDFQHLAKVYDAAHPRARKKK